MLVYPTFSVSGVPSDRTWELFNCSNYEYYKRKIKEIISGICPFCTVDGSINQIFFESGEWMVWENIVAPRPESKHQLLFVPKRHVERVTDLTMNEFSKFHSFFKAALDSDYCKSNQITDDGAFIIRTGDSAMNAKSVSHLHFNLHIPSGRVKAEVTIGKSKDDINGKLPLLKIWEKMRQLEISLQEDNLPTPPNWETFLTMDDWVMTKDKLEAPKKK
jgi:diadenosine tetraphosphate (Ap4A) HIT family hydrolase